MYEARKANKVYEIDKPQIDEYAASGYDIFDAKGKLVKHAAGKTVPYAKYEELLEENKKLKAKIEKSKAKD